MTRFAFLSGLPRSGSTLIASILSQRDDVYVSTLSDASEVVRHAHIVMPEAENYRAGATEQRESLLRNALPAMYSHVDAPLVIDKSRAWGTPYYRRALLEALGEPPLILAPVRPLKEIVASFIRLCRQYPDNYIDRAMVDEDFYPYWRKPIDDARTDWLLQANGHLGAAMLGLHGAFDEEASNQFHVIPYSQLTSEPKQALSGIEAFLGIDSFDYSFNRIEGAMHNDAEVYGIPTMHEVRHKIKRIDPDPDGILSAYAVARCELEDFWTCVLR